MIFPRNINFCNLYLRIYKIKRNPAPADSLIMEGVANGEPIMINGRNDQVKFRDFSEFVAKNIQILRNSAIADTLMDRRSCKWRANND